MPFALHLRDQLQHRESRIAGEFAAGDSLEEVLSRHLLAVEGSAETELLTSILLLDETGTRLRHGAAPNLPDEYCEAINGAEIGPNAGSCGTAAYTGHAVYVTDVATDPLWNEYRHLALPHGLRACWSTPIRDPEGAVIGTFAVYHPTPRSPTPDEVKAIRLITDHVSQAIVWSRSEQLESRHDDSDDERRIGASLRLVGDSDGLATADDATLQVRASGPGRLHGYAARLDRYAGMVSSQRIAAALKAVAADCRKLAASGRDVREEPKDER